MFTDFETALKDTEQTKAEILRKCINDFIRRSKRVSSENKEN